VGRKGVDRAGVVHVAVVKKKPDILLVPGQVEMVDPARHPQTCPYFSDIETERKEKLSTIVLAGETNMKSIVRALSRLFKVAIGKEFIVRPDVVCAKERFGSAYGGWDVITTSIDTHSIVYSFGVGDDASFDTALIEKFNLTIHAFDPTPKSIAWVKKQRLSDRFVMHDYGIAAFDGNASFNPPENPDHVSHTLLERPSTRAKAISVPVKRLSTIMEELGHEHIDVLKMDIEGAEYDVIKDINESDIRPRQILVEFHHRFPNVGIKRSKEAIDGLRYMGYQVFSVSATNEEYCFVHNFSQQVVAPDGGVSVDSIK
jgi:FkbM family methyltransferase